jgi:hypothetical protein
VITSHRKAGASAEEGLTSGGQVEKELVASCKENLARVTMLNKQKHTLVREVSIWLDVVRGLNEFRNSEGVGGMGKASLLAVVAQHPRFTMLAIAIAKDAVRTTCIKLEGEIRGVGQS